jgi:hypothetical protein
MPTSSSSSPSVSRPSSSHHRLNKLSISTVDKLSIVGSAVGDKIPDYIPGFKTSAGKHLSAHVLCDREKFGTLS